MITTNDTRIKLGTFSIDVELQPDGRYDVFIGREGSSGEHYLNLTPEDVGKIIADDIYSVSKAIGGTQSTCHK